MDMFDLYSDDASLTKSPTRAVKTQCNHIYASIIAY